MTSDMFGVIAGLLSAMPAQQRWDDGVASLYAFALKDISDEDGWSAVTALIQTVDYRPSPASIIRKVALIKNPEIDTSRAMSRINRFIAYTHPSERDRQVQRYLDLGRLYQSDIELVEFLGGWNAIGNRTAEVNAKMVERWEKTQEQDKYPAIAQQSNRKAIANV